MKTFLILSTLFFCLNQAVASQEFNCSDGVTQLFGVKLKCATREQLIDALKAKENKEHRILSSQYKDTIRSTGDLIDKTRNLTLYYTEKGSFAEAVYNFYTLGSKGTRYVVSLVSSKYGKPQTLEVKNGYDKKTHYIWHQPDGIIISVYEWDDGIYLKYTLPKNKSLMEQDKRAFESRKQKALFQQQRDSF